MRFPAYVFDAYGTLFDVHSAVGRHRAHIGAQAEVLSNLWRTKQLEYTWVRSLMGRYRTFDELTTEALDFAARRCGGISRTLRDALLQSYRTLDAYPEVAGALARLRAAGARTAILSNGTPEMLASAITSAGLAAHFDAVLSVDELRIYKTAPEVYQMACERLNARPAEISFQSSNRWDIAGASAFGYRTAWINRTDQPDEYGDCPPDAVYKSLDGLTADLD